MALGAMCASAFAACASEEGDRQIDEPSSVEPTGGGTSLGGASSGGGPSLNLGGSFPQGTPDKPAPTCSKDCPDFPEDPILDTTGDVALPDDVAALFGEPSDGDTGSGPCVLEPPIAVGDAPGALFPANWLRPRIRFEPAGDEDVFEIRLTTAREKHELVAYTTNTTWTVPRDVWKGVAQNVHMEPIFVTVRALSSKSPGKPSKTRGSFQIAPVNARGSLVYWAATSQEVNPDTSKLVGFSVGDEGTLDALSVMQVGNRDVIAPTGVELRKTPDANAVKDPGHVQCIGCHTSTPDGEAVAFTDLWPWNGLVASIEEETVGEQPSYVTDGAARLLGQPWLGMMTMSPGQWTEDRRIVVSSYSKRKTAQGGDVGFDLIPQGKDGIAWFNLAADVDVPFKAGDSAPLNAAIEDAQGTAWGLVSLVGETRAALAPELSQDGKRLVYTSADVSQDGRIGAGNSAVDLHEVPFNDGKGGAVKAIEGASEAGIAEYYPALSADDRFIAFNRAPLDAASVYYRKDGEVYVVPSDGGDAVRLAANDPVACSGQTSPGVINSWPKWSPSVIEHEGKNYYFLVFSSGRSYPGQSELPESPYSPPDRRMSQLYMAALVEDVETGKVESFDAVYLWNQDPAWSNLTPAWDVFQLPPIPDPK